jgi:hypothetical protein
MIQSIINQLTSSEKEQVKKVTEDVNDSIVHGSENVNSKIFSAADLWNIQRKRKMMVQRRWSL